MQKYNPLHCPYFHKVSNISSIGWNDKKVYSVTIMDNFKEHEYVDTITEFSENFEKIYRIFP